MRASIITSAIVAGLSTVVSAFPPFIPHHNHSSVASTDTNQAGTPVSWESIPVPVPATGKNNAPWATDVYTISATPEILTLTGSAPNDFPTVDSTLTSTDTKRESKTPSHVTSLPDDPIEPNTQTEDSPGHAPPSFPFSAPSTPITTSFSRPCPADPFPSSLFPNETPPDSFYFSTAADVPASETKVDTFTGSQISSVVPTSSILAETETETESFSGPFEYSNTVSIPTTNFPAWFPTTEPTLTIPVVTDTFSTDFPTNESTSTITEFETVSVTIAPSSEEPTLTITTTDTLSGPSVVSEPASTSTVTQIITLSSGSLSGSVPSSSVVLSGFTFTSDASIEITATNPLSSDLSRASGFGIATSNLASSSTPSPQFTNSTISAAVFSGTLNATASPVESVLSAASSHLSVATSILATKSTPTDTAPLAPSPLTSNSSSTTSLFASTLAQNTDPSGSDSASVTSAISAGHSSGDAIRSSSSNPFSMSTSTETDTNTLLPDSEPTHLSSANANSILATGYTPILTVTVSPLPLSTGPIKPRAHTTLSTSTIPATEDPFASVLASISSDLAAGVPVASIISEVNSIISAAITTATSTAAKLPKPKYTDTSLNPGVKLRDEASTPTDDGNVCACSIAPGEDSLCTRDCECCMDKEHEVSLGSPHTHICIGIHKLSVRRRFVSDGVFPCVDTVVTNGTE